MLESGNKRPLTLEGPYLPLSGYILANNMDQLGTYPLIDLIYEGITT